MLQSMESQRIEHDWATEQKQQNQSIFSDHSIMKLKINNKKNWKIHKFVEIKQHTFTQPMSQGRNHKEFRNYLETNGGLGKSLGEGE